MNKRLKFLVVLSFAGFSLLCWTLDPSMAADRLRIGLSSFTPINGAIWVAEEKGLFKKYGIEPEVT